jgi:hypothetical protein
MMALLVSEQVGGSASSIPAPIFLTTMQIDQQDFYYRLVFSRETRYFDIWLAFPTAPVAFLPTDQR